MYQTLPMAYGYAVVCTIVFLFVGHYVIEAKLG